MPTTTPKKTVKTAGLTEAALRQLVAGGVVTAIRVSRERGATYVVLADMGTTHAQLLNTRGEPRTFSSLDTAAAAVSRLGASEFTTHLTKRTTR
jgi:predicted metal-dependent enzyme (double-stranded beta helix superfamily)